MSTRCRYTKTNVVNGVNVERMNEIVQSIEHNSVLGKTTFHAISKWTGGSDVKTNIREFTLGYRNIAVRCRIATDASRDALKELWEQA